VDRAEFLAASAAFVLWRPLHELERSAVSPILRELDRAVAGPVLLPPSPGWQAAREVYNVRYSGAKPLAVVRAKNAADVRAVVRWGRAHGIRVIPRSGGHSYAGYSTGSGVVVDLSTLRGVRLASGGIATIGPATRLYDVYAALAARGRAIAAGSCPTVGFGGLALGGGVGLAARKLGTTSDNVVGMTVATGDGRLLTCDARRNPDLYWALRGGGGRNFGIVTSFRVKTAPVTAGSWFVATFDWAAGPDVVPAWQRWAPGADPRLTTICSLGSAQTLQVFGQFLGPETQLQALLPPFVRAAPRLRTGSASWLDLQLRWAGCLGDSPAECRAFEPTRFAAKSDYIGRPMSAAAVRAVQSRLERRGTGSGSVLMDSYGGAIRHGTGAFTHRNSICSVQELAYWPAGTPAAPALAWLRALERDLRPHVTGGKYVNYIDPDQKTGYRAAYYGANAARLVAIRPRYDPDRVFRFAQAI
jgi:FAD/FMN-containing dehydrogenase